MMQKLIEFDKWLFLKLNRDAANSLFDALMPFLRNPLFWLPLYLFILLFIIMNFPRKAFAWIIGAAATSSATDLISSHFIKPTVGRIRPCNDPDLVGNIHVLVNYCGQNGSFTSSHAANHFGIAMFLFLTLRDVWGNYCYLFFVWAFAICYAQIYVGVHFPFDIVGGAVVGLMIGYISGTIFHKRIGRLKI
jgi:membrane-associated phospholipid phosphatase